MTCPDGCVLVGQTSTQAHDVVGWALVILGWFVVSRLQSRREHQKNLHARIGEMIRTIEIVEAKSHEYIGSTKGGTPESCALELQLRTSLQRLGMSLENLRQRERIKVESEFIDFRVAVTGREFETKTREPASLDLHWPHDVSEKANRLINALENARS